MEVVDLPEPSAAAGEVLLRMEYVGFCGSDLNTFRGANALAKSPVIPGHEIGAVIEAAGPGVPGFLQPGMTVTVNPYTACGTCPSCRGRLISRLYSAALASAAFSQASGSSAEAKAPSSFTFGS